MFILFLIIACSPITTTKKKFYFNKKKEEGRPPQNWAQDFWRSALLFFYFVPQLPPAWPPPEQPQLGWGFTLLGKPQMWLVWQPQPHWYNGEIIGTFLAWLYSNILWWKGVKKIAKLTIATDIKIIINPNSKGFL